MTHPLVGDREQVSSLSVSMKVLDAIAQAEGVDPTDLDRPLATVTDPDALDTLYQTGEAPVSVEFDYLGYRVTVRKDGEVSISVVDDMRRSTV